MISNLWVESTGGANFGGHFMVNNGDGTFTADPDLAIYQLRHNPSPEFWRHNSGHLVDRDNDGDLDLVLGQMRGTASDTTNQFSIVLLNDGTGYYPSRIELPHPAFNQGLHRSPRSDAFRRQRRRVPGPSAHASAQR